MLIALLNKNLNILKLNFYIIFLLYFSNFKPCSSAEAQDPEAPDETSQECSDSYPLISIECLKNKLIFDF